MPIKIIIADDHAIVRSGLELLLNSQSYYQVVASVANGESLIDACRKNEPDLIITDLSMPTLGGVELIRRLRLKWPDIDLAIFSIYQNPYLAMRLIEMGVKGYISKSSDTEVILAAIAAITQGKHYISPDISIPSDQGEPLARLSARELDIFSCIFDGLSTKKISEKLFLSEKTIANKVSIMKKKLKVSNLNEMMQLGMLEGFI